MQEVCCTFPTRSKLLEAAGEAVEGTHLSLLQWYISIAMLNTFRGGTRTHDANSPYLQRWAPTTTLGALNIFSETLYQECSYN